MIYACIHNYICTCEHTLFFLYTRTYWSKSIEQTLVMTGNSAAPKTVAAVTATHVKRKLHVWIEPKKRGLNVPSLYVLLEYDVRFVLLQYHTCCTLSNRACQDIHLSHNWHSKCKDTMKIRHRKCREGNTVSSPWVECRQAWFSCLFYIQIKETILCCLPCISCDVFSSCLCIYCANCRPYTLQTWKSIEFETCWTLTADCIFEHRKYA